MDLIREITDRSKELSSKEKDIIIRMLDTISIVDDEIELESRIDKLVENEVRM